MPAKFNAAEVFEMGLQVERNGHEFYRRAAEQAVEEPVRKMLLDLASMEQDHEKLFEELKAALPPNADPGSAYDPNGEAILYLQAAADTHVFNREKADPECLTHGRSAEQILQTAMEFEKDSVVFFLGMMDLVPEGLGRSQVEGLVREEMAHITTLSAQLQAVRAASGKR